MRWSASIVEELTVESTDIHVAKYRMSGFQDTELDSILRNLNVTTLLFAGAQDVFFPGEAVVARARKIIRRLVAAEILPGSRHIPSRQGFETIVRNGRDQPNFPGVMPPVADGWSKQQLDALFTYVGSKVVGGGGGG